MRTAFTSIVGLICCVSLAAQSLVPVEENIVGTWRWKTLPGKHGMLRFEFRRDHTFEGSDHSAKKPMAVSGGTWRLEGHDLITEEQAISHAGESQSRIHRKRLTIRVFSDDRIAFTIGGVIQRVKD
jgi:hypothetical protein